MEKKEFRTTNIEKAVHCLLCGGKLKGIRWVNARNAEFVFDDFLQEWEDSFYNEEVKFATARVIQEYKMLKRKIFDGGLKIQ